MNESQETLNQKNSAVLKAIADLSTKFGDLENRFENLENRFGSLENRFENLEKTVNIQFEVIREGISYNSAKFDRLEAKIYDARSDISNLRADIKEMTEEIRRQRTKETLVLEK